MAETIDFRIVDELEESGMRFKMFKTDPVSKAIKAYCTKTNKDILNLRFVFEGQRIDVGTVRDTPLSLGMEQGDSINVHPMTDGGH